MPDNLRHTLLLASALRKFGPDHRAVELLQNPVRQRGKGAISTAKKGIEELHSNEREEMLSCFEGLCALLPDEALAA